MAEAGATDFKSPKTPRRLKTPDPNRQVHFEGDTKTNNNSKKQEQQGTFSTGNTFPDTFPQVGAAPGTGAHLNWHTSATPTQSVNVPNIYQPYTPGGPFTAAPQHAHPAPQNSHPFISSLPPTTPQFLQPQTSGITYIGQQQPATQVNMAADYQNAAPLPTGVHFQPPVPDTTFGPIPHVYVPRFDGGLVSGVQQPAVQQPCVQGGYVVAQQPYLIQQPVMGQQPILGQQPVMINAQPAIAPQPQVVNVQGMPAVGLGGGVATMSGGIPVCAGNHGHIPEVTGVGRTAGEEQLRQVKFAHANRLYEPQEFKPADDDPSRYYYVRELDGNWTQRNRFTIDTMDCRWYVTDEGWFYAVRLPD